jgi:hypothetical protein
MNYDTDAVRRQTIAALRGQQSYASPGVQADADSYTPPNGNTGVTGGLGAVAARAAQSAQYAPIQGFDFDKLTGAKPYDSAQKYSPAVRAFSHGLGSGIQVRRNDMGAMIDYLKANGFGGASQVGDDKIDFGDGEGGIDVLTSDGRIWFQNGADRFAPQTPPPPGGPGGPGAPGGPGSGPNAFNDKVRAQILELIGKDPSAVSANDPALAPQIAAHRAAMDRSQRIAQNEMAERFHGAGVSTSSSGFVNEIGRSRDAAAQSGAAYEADLVGREIADRRNQLMQALQLGAGVLSDSERLAAQRELSELDAALRRESMTLQNNQFNSRLGFDIGSREADMNALILQMLLGGR